MSDQGSGTVFITEIITRYFCINSDPTTLRNVADVWLATALANRVFPGNKTKCELGITSRDLNTCSQSHLNHIFECIF